MKFSRCSWAILLCLPLAASAAPRLRLDAAAIGPLQTPVGGVPEKRTIYARNAGDGSLALTARSNQAWVSPVVKPQIFCPDDKNQQTYCVPLEFTFQTAALARGLYTAVVTIADPNAIDAPQTITVTVRVGTTVPDQVQLYLPTNRDAVQTSFYASSTLNAQASTQGGGNWLSVAMDGAGTTGFSQPYIITATRQPGMGEGDYEGAVQVSGSSFADDNRSITVKLKVTSKPILRARILQPTRLRLGDGFEFRTAAGAAETFLDAYLMNDGAGTLELQNASVTMQTGSNWLKADLYADYRLLRVTVNPSALSAGTYHGTVQVVSNAANSPLQIPVVAEVLEPAAPAADYQGARNNATFLKAEPLSQGTIAALYGEHFTYGPTTPAPDDRSGPLPGVLAGTRVLVNGRPAPLWFVSFEQINFQVPYETPVGEAIVQVERNGQLGNKIAVNVAPALPRLLPLRDEFFEERGGYGIVVIYDPTSADPLFPLPAALCPPGARCRPARPGEYLTLYAIGLGQTTPPADTGAFVPLSPLREMSPRPTVILGSGSPFGGSPYDRVVSPAFAGLSPGWVGLYQINFQVPPNPERGDAVELRISTEHGASNTVKIAIQ